MRGRLHLGFQVEGGETRLRDVEQSPPLRVVRAFAHGSGVLVHLHNVSGGVLGGDVLDTRVVLGPGSRVLLTTTGAIRIYRRKREQGPAVVTTRFEVGSDAVLEYLPDALIPYAHADYRQQTTIHLSPGAGLFWWEVVTPGRDAGGEVFRYDRVDLRSDVLCDERPLALERICLEPALRPPQSSARLGVYRYFTTFYICRVGIPAATWPDLEARLSDVALERSHPGQEVWGVSTLAAHGVVVRGLSVRGRGLEAGLQQFWQTARQALYGEAALPPRKLY